AKTSREAGEAYGTLLEKLRSLGLDKAQNDPDVGIALQVAWERSRAAEPKRPPQPQRFFGFVEGLTRFTPPTRWEIMVLGCCLKDHPQAHSAALDEYLPRSPFLEKRPDTFVYTPEVFQEIGLDLRGPADTRLRREQGKIVITVGTATLATASEVFEGPRKEY